MPQFSPWKSVPQVDDYTLALPIGNPGWELNFTYIILKSIYLCIYIFLIIFSSVSFIQSAVAGWLGMRQLCYPLGMVFWK